MSTANPIRDMLRGTCPETREPLITCTCDRCENARAWSIDTNPQPRDDAAPATTIARMPEPVGRRLRKGPLA